MTVVKGVMLRLLGGFIVLAMLPLLFGAVTGHNGNWIVIGFLFVVLLFISEAYRHLK